MNDISEQSQHQSDASLSSLLEFPTEFPIKVMGKNTSEFRAFVLKVAREHIPSKKLLRIDEQLSSNEKYLSCTIVGVFDDQAHIDGVYQDLTANPLVLMAL